MGFCLPLRLEFCERRRMPQIGDAMRSDGGEGCAVTRKGQVQEPRFFSEQSDQFTKGGQVPNFDRVFESTQRRQPARASDEKTTPRTALRCARNRFYCRRVDTSQRMTSPSSLALARSFHRGRRGGRRRRRGDR